MTLENRHLHIFVATAESDVPADARPFVSVDGAVPGATVTWDHHHTGELLNLYAMPLSVEVSALRGIGTTMADTDAAISVALVLIGGIERLSAARRGTLEAAAHWCDLLRPHPKLDDETNASGERVHAWVTQRLTEADDVGRAFAQACRELARRLDAGVPLPTAEPARVADAPRVAALEAEGRIVRQGRIALVDLRGRGRVDPLAMYERVGCAVAVIVSDHETGGSRYTVGVNPFVESAPADLRPALEILAREEYRHGPPCASPLAGHEGSWGGRASVFGSPFRYASRLDPAEVVSLVRGVLDG